MRQIEKPAIAIYIYLLTDHTYALIFFSCEKNDVYVRCTASEQTNNSVFLLIRFVVYVGSMGYLCLFVNTNIFRTFSEIEKRRTKQ